MSCLNHIKEKVIVGTTKGEVKVFTDDDLTELYTIKDERVPQHTPSIMSHSINLAVTLDSFDHHSHSLTKQ